MTTPATPRTAPLTRTGATATHNKVMIVVLAVFLACTLTACNVPGRDGLTASEREAQQSSSQAAALHGLHNVQVGNQNPEILASVVPHLPTTTPSYTRRTGSSEPSMVTVSRADRILALDRSGALASSVYSLGMGDRLVGRDTSTDFPAASHLPIVTPGGHTVNIEAIMNLKPDVIFTDGTIGPKSVFKQLADSGISVIYTDQDRKISTIGDLFVQLGQSFGDKSAGQKASDTLTAKVKDAKQASFQLASHAANKPRVLVLYLRGTNISMIAGPSSGASELIEAAGGVDAGANLGINSSFTNLTAEALIKAAPDTVIVMEKGLESIGGLSGLHSLPGFDQTPAGRNDSVITVPDSQLLSFGPSCPEVISGISKALYSSKDF